MNTVVYFIFLVALLVVFLIGLKWNTEREVHSLSRDTCNVLKGYAILLIVIHHMVLRMSHVGILLPFRLAGYLGVSVFFFLSGYGLTCAAKNREKAYSNNFIFKRIKKIYIPAVIAQFVYLLVLMSFFDKSYSAGDFLKGLFFLYPVDTSQWYIIAVFYWYIAFWLFMKCFTSWRNTIIGLFAMALLYIIICLSVGASKNWVDTAVCFPLGVMFAASGEKPFSMINKYGKMLFVPAVLFAVTVFFSYGKTDYAALVLRIMSSMLFLLIILMTLKYIDISKNRLVGYIGTITLECYLVHGKVIRIVKLAFGDVKAIEMLIYFAATILIVVLFSWFLKKYNQAWNALKDRHLGGL